MPKLAQTLEQVKRYVVHVVGLSTNKSQKMSKCGKNNSDTLACHFFVVNTF